MSAALLHILHRWLTDAVAEQPSSAVRTRGLCSYVRQRAPSKDVVYEFSAIMRQQFPERSTYPFDDGPEGYNRALLDEVMHLNQQRILWVIKTLQGTQQVPPEVGWEPL